jgi:hypothetical protein
MPHSVRKFIRKGKARIRREVLDVKEQDRQINGLYEKFSKDSKAKNSKAKDKKQTSKPAESVLPIPKTATN